MALNDTFSIKILNWIKKPLFINPKDLKLIGIKNVQSIQVTTIAKFLWLIP